MRPSVCLSSSFQAFRSRGVKGSGGHLDAPPGRGDFIKNQGFRGGCLVHVTLFSLRSNLFYVYQLIYN